MKISQEAVTDANIIRDYGDGFLLIQTPEGEPHQITEDGLLTATSWSPVSALPLTQTLSDYLKTQHCDILILISQSGVDLTLYQQAQVYTREGVSAEVMQLGPACRTFNLLVHEGRSPALLITF